MASPSFASSSKQRREKTESLLPLGVEVLLPAPLKLSFLLLQRFQIPPLLSNSPDFQPLTPFSDRLIPQLDDRHLHRDFVSWSVMDRGDLVSAFKVFEKMPGRIAITWTLMVTWFMKFGNPEEAVNLFLDMILNGKEPDRLEYYPIARAAVAFSSHMRWVDSGLLCWLLSTYLFQHSEKIAVAFGLISTSKFKPIRAFKNPRIYGDCQTVTLHLSTLQWPRPQRLLVRDANRFHHIKDGRCSCNDYW